MSEKVQDCRSAQGQTTGLVDAIHHVSRAAMDGDMTHPDVQAALADLNEEKAFRALVAAAQAASDAHQAAKAAVGQ